LKIKFHTTAPISKLILIWVFVWTVNIYSQITPNLVSNFSFEILDSCLDNPGQINRVYLWKNANTGSPDAYSSCCSNFPFCSNPLNWAGLQPPATGNNYIGLGFATPLLFPYQYRESVYMDLDTILKSNKKYVTGFFISLADSAEYIMPDIKIYLSDSVVLDTVNLSNGKWNPLIENEFNLSFNLSDIDSINWKKKCKYFTGISKRFLTLGNNTSSITYSPTGVNSYYGDKFIYYFIDDVFIHEIFDVQIDTNYLFLCNNGFSVEANNVEEYRWYKYPDTLTVITTDSVLSYFPTGNSKFLVKGRTCDYISWDTIDVKVCDKDFIQVYPNPTSDYIQLNFQQSWHTGTDVYVYDDLGQVIHIHKNYIPNTPLILPILADALYFYEVVMDGNTKFRGKFVYKK
jgi:hypothetical protein